MSVYKNIDANNGSEKLWTKNTATSGKIVKAAYASYVLFMFFVQVSQGGWSVILCLLD
jgi:hypothetical protein